MSPGAVSGRYARPAVPLDPKKCSGKGFTLKTHRIWAWGGAHSSNGLGAAPTAQIRFVFVCYGSTGDGGREQARVRGRANDAT
eukprot:3604063-Prymnesium_polylepis.1